MPDFNNINTQPTQVADVLAPQVIVEKQERPDTIFDKQQRDAVEQAAHHQANAAKVKFQQQKDREDNITAVTDNVMKQLMPNVSMLNPKFAEARTKVADKVRGKLAKQDFDQEEAIDKKFSTMPKQMFGFGTDNDLDSKVGQLRDEVYGGAKQATELAPEAIRPSEYNKVLSPFKSSVQETMVNKLWGVGENIAQLTGKDESVLEKFRLDAAHQYKNTDPQFVEKKANEMYKDYIIHKAKKENPNDFADEGFTKYIDDKGNPTIQLKKDAWEIAGGDATKLADATKQILDYERGDFKSAKSRNLQNYERIQQMMANRAGGLPYVLQRTLSGVLDAVDPEMAAVKGIFGKGSYSDIISKEAKKKQETEPMSIPVNLEDKPYLKAASDLTYGITNMLTRASLFNSLGGESKPLAKNFVNDLVAEAPSYKAAAPYITAALKSAPVSKLANITDKALEVSKIFFVPTLNGNIQKYHELGYDDASAYQKAFKESVASMYIYSLMSHEGAGAKEQFARLLNPEEKALFSNVSNIVKGAAISGSAMATNQVYEDYSQQGDKFNLHNSLTKAQEPFLQGVLFDIAMKAINPQQLLSKSPQTDAIAYFMRNREGLQKEVEGAVVNKKMTSQQGLDMLKSMNAMSNDFNEGVKKGLSDKAATQYATEKAKYKLLSDAVAHQENNPNADQTQLNNLKQRRAESAKDVLRIQEGTYLKGKVISSDEMAKVAMQTKPEYEKPKQTQERKAAVKLNAPFVQNKIALETLKTDEKVANNLKILENRDKLQVNVDAHNKLQEEIDLIENAHKGISGVREAIEPDEKTGETLSKLKAHQKAIDKSLEAVGGIKAVKEMLDYNDDANNGYIIVGRKGDVLNGSKQAATRLFNGDKTGTVVRALNEQERANLSKKDVSTELAKDLKIAPSPILTEAAEQVEIPIENTKTNNNEELERILPNTLSSEEKQGSIAGGETNAAATAIVGRLSETNQSVGGGRENVPQEGNDVAGKEVEVTNNEVTHEQPTIEEHLKGEGEDNGKGIPPSDAANEGLRAAGEGSSQEVSPEGKTVEETPTSENKDIEKELDDIINEIYNKNETGKTNTTATQEGSTDISKGGDAKKVKIHKKRAKPTVKSPEFLLALSHETTDPYDKALQYFIGGGTVATESLKKMWRNSNGEIKARIGLRKEGSPTINEIAHSMWEDRPDHDDRFTDQDYQNAVETVLNNHVSRSSMAKDINNRWTDKREIEGQEYWDAINEVTNDESVSEEVYDVFSQMTDEQIQKLLDDEAQSQDEYYNSKEFKQLYEEIKPDVSGDNDIIAIKQKIEEVKRAKEVAKNKLAKQQSKDAQTNIFGKEDNGMFSHEEGLDASDKVIREALQPYDSELAKLNRDLEEATFLKQREKKLSDKLRDYANKLDSNTDLFSAPILTPKVMAKAVRIIADAIDAGVSIKDAFIKGLEELEKILKRKPTVEEAKELKENLINKLDAVQKSSAEKVHGSTQEGTPSEGGEHQGVGTSEQREVAPEPSAEKKGEEGIGVTNADTEMMRGKLGLPQIEKEARKSNQQVWDEVRSKGDLAIKDIVRRLATTLKTPEVTTENQAAILIDRVRIANEYNKLQEEKAQALDKQDKDTLTDLFVKEAQLELDRDNNDLANTRLGAEWGGVGNFRQGISNLEYTYENVVREFKNANDGKISAEERKFFENKIKDLEKLNDEYVDWKKNEGKRDEELRQAHYDEFYKNFKQENEGKKYATKAKEAANTFRKALKTKNNWVDADGNPLQVFKGSILEWNDIVEYGAKVIEKTGEIADGVAAIVEKLSNMKWFKDLSDRDKEAVEQQIKAEFEKSFGSKDTFDSVVEDLVSRAKGEFDQKKLDSTLQKLLRIAVQDGAKNIKEVVDRIQQSIDGKLEVSDEDLGDALSGYGNYKKLNQEQLNVQIRKIKSFGRLDAAIRDVKERGKLPKRTGFERDTLDVEQRAKKKELMTAVKESGLEPTLTEEELANQYKSDLEAHHKRLTNSIEDIQRELDTHIKNRKAEGKKYDDDESIKLQAQLDALKKQRDKEFPKEPMSDEKRAEIVTKNLNRAIDELFAEIEALEHGQLKEPKESRSAVTNAKIEGLKRVKKAFEAKRDALTPENVKLEAKYNKWVDSREKLLTKLETKLKNNDFAPKFKYEFAKNPTTEKGQQLQYKINKTRNEIRRKVEAAKVNQRKGLEKFIDTFPSLKKAAIFMGFKIYPKLISAVALMHAITTARKGVQYGLSQLPYLRDIAEKAPTEGYAGFKKGGEKLIDNLAETFVRNWAKTYQEAKLAINNEQRFIDRYEKHYKGVDKNMYGRIARFLINTHKGIKTFAEVPEYHAAMLNATKWAIENGLNPHELQVQDMIHTFAKDAASNQILMSKTAAATWYKGALGMLKNMGDDKTMQGKTTRVFGKGIAALLETEIPIVGVPINTVNEALSYFGGAAKAALLASKGMDKITNSDADRIMKLTGKNVVGALSLAIAYSFHNYFGGLYHRGKQDENGLKEGELGTSDFPISAILLHHPMIYADMVWADVQNQMEKYPDKSFANTLFGAINAVANTIPYVAEMSRIGEAFSGEKGFSRFTADFLTGFEPQIIKEVAKYTDTDENGDIIHRYPQGIWQGIEANIPLVRKNVPTGTDIEQEKRKKAEEEDTPEEAAAKERKAEIKKKADILNDIKGLTEQINYDKSHPNEPPKVYITHDKDKATTLQEKINMVNFYKALLK